MTIADREAEAAIRREIHRVYPDHGVLGEEQGFEQGASEYTWVIDPIDGTRAFILGQLHWGTLIALSDGSRPIIGVMRQPYTAETFVGSSLGTELRRGAECRTLTARKATRLEDAVVCATDPTMFETPERRRHSTGVARTRAPFVMAEIATPRAWSLRAAPTWWWNAGLKPWDVQPLIPILEGAGGVITAWSGGRADAADNMVIASIAGCIAWRLNC